MADQPVDPFAFTPADVDPETFDNALKAIGIPLGGYVIDHWNDLAGLSPAKLVNFIASAALSTALGVGVIQLTDPSTWPRWFPGDWHDAMPPALAKEGDRG